MKPMAILASLLTLAAAQDVPQSTPGDASSEPTSINPTPEPPAFSAGPLTTLVRDRSALYVDMAKTKHTPVRPRARDPFVFPAEQDAGKSLAILEAERAEAARAEREAAANQDPSDSRSSAAATPPPDPAEAVVVSLRALEINAVLVATNGGSCLVRGDIVRVGDTLLGGRATLTKVARDGVSFTVGERVVDVLLVEPRSRSKSDDSLPSSSIESEDMSP